MPYASRRSYGRNYVRGQGAYYIPAAPARRAPRTVPRKTTTVARRRIAGRGEYKLFDAPAIGDAIGGWAGGALGNVVAPGIGGGVGRKAGSMVGKALGKAFRTITGFGDYEIHENTVLYPDRVVPSFGDDSIRVKKREYITDINASTLFSNNVFSVNPGLNETFPWLSSIANCYEQYRFNGLVFQFVSTSSDAIASTTDLGLGQVILATDYNAADAAYVNAPQMLGAMFSNSGKPSENIMHAIECAPNEQSQKLYYVRSGDHPEGTDIRLYDLCTFQLATQKMPAVYDGMGQLWVTYDVTFCKSVQNNQLGFDLNTDAYDLTAPAVTSSYFGTSRSLREHSNLGTTVTGTVISFPPTLSSGYYLINYHVAGSAAAVVDPTVTPANCAIVSGFNGGASGISNSLTTSGNYITLFLVRITARDATITLSGGTLPSPGTIGNLVITQVNGEIYA